MEPRLLHHDWGHDPLRIDRPGSNGLRNMVHIVTQNGRIPWQLNHFHPSCLVVNLPPCSVLTRPRPLRSARLLRNVANYPRWLNSGGIFPG
jgi:hypothetical protein